MSQIQYFTNDNFRTLAYLCDMKGANHKAHITQQDGKHVGRYILTEKALSVIETFRMIENK